MNRLIEEEIERQELDKTVTTTVYFKSSPEQAKEIQRLCDNLINEIEDNNISNSMTYFNEVLNHKNTNSTRHKSKDGENHKDSRIRFESSFDSVFPQQGIKETSGKTDYSEINLSILDLMAERFTANKHKYPKGNSLKPINKKDLVWALFRHVKKIIKEESNDSETFKDHLSAILCNSSMILDQLEIKTN